MVRILDLVRSHGLELRKASSAKGGEYQGPCPGCGGRDRFHVWPEQNDGEGSYWCRQCGRGGDAIQFLRDFEGLTFREACSRLGRAEPDPRVPAMPRQREPAAWEPRRYESPEAQWREKAARFSIWAYEQLMENPRQLAFLAARGIREETVSRYGLGWNPGKDGKDLYRTREAWGLSRVINQETGRPRPLWLPIGLVIPCFFDDAIQRLRIRRPEPRKFGPPYYLVPGSSMGTMVIHPHRKAHVIVESELDGILIAQEAGDIVGVVAVGSASTKPDKQATAVLSRSRHILNALDFDGAGAKYWPWWERQFEESERWPVPEGKDPGECFKAGINLREWILAGLPEGLRFFEAKGAA